MGKLTALKVSKLQEPGRYHDGDGLMLNVTPGGSKSWVLRVQSKGRRRDLGIGSLKVISLQAAREQAVVLRQKLRAGIDPVMEKKAEVAITTFEQAAEALISEQRATWKNVKHAAQWGSTLANYALPTLGKVAVADITSPMVRDAVLPIWLGKPETARRVLQRIGAVLEWATAKGIRTAGMSTSAVRRGLPRQVDRVEHHPAMPYGDLPEFMRKLANAAPTTGRIALRCLILTACRSGEIRGARWSELDLDQGLWTIPAERMKGGRPHQVTLCERAVLQFFMAMALAREEGVDLVFPGQNGRKPISDMTLTKLLRDAKVPYSVHGFRSAFRDWAADCTDYAGEVAEAALAHVNTNKVEAAYRRTSFVEKRRALLSEWAEHCFSYQ